MNAEAKEFTKDTKRIEKFDVTLSAIGARWGILAESAFRQALRGMFEDRFGVKVSEWITEDKAGYVFGHPSIVQMDVVVKNGEHWLIGVNHPSLLGGACTVRSKGNWLIRERGKKEW